MNLTIMTEQDTAKRRYWIDEISQLSGNFGVDSERVEQEISKEIKTDGMAALLSHLRLCGVIPEGYGHDSSEEPEFAP